jgi:hypothetical protein
MTKPEFNWSNDDWALTFLPHVRVAVVHLSQDNDGQEAALSEIAQHGLVPELLQGWRGTRAHLLSLVEMIDAALEQARPIELMVAVMWLMLVLALHV